MINIPTFKEVYTHTVKKTGVSELHKIICEIKDIETDQVLSFGFTRISNEKKIKLNVGKKLAYASAMRYLFIKLNNGVKNVEDKTEEIIEEKS